MFASLTVPEDDLEGACHILIAAEGPPAYARRSKSSALQIRFDPFSAQEDPKQYETTDDNRDTTKRAPDGDVSVVHCNVAERQAMRRRPNGQAHQPLTLPAFA